MKIRTFIITFMAPCLLFLLSAQLILSAISNYRNRDEALSSLELAVMLQHNINGDSISVISSKIQMISGNVTKRISPSEELERFKSKFGVNVMEVLTDNPFGETILTSVGFDDDPNVVMASIRKINGVEYVAYPENKRSQIIKSFEDSRIKFTILSFFLAIGILMLSWLSEKFECVANEYIVDKNRESHMPLDKIKSAFQKRSFVKGVFIGFVASVLFILLRAALTMNEEVYLIADFETCLLISAFIILASTIITYLMQMISLKAIIKKNN